MWRTLAVAYTRIIGVVFLLIAGTMVVVPHVNLAGDGIDFASFPVAGKAEVRAYYVGTALCVARTVLVSELRSALLAVAIVLGGFAGTRVVAYALDGVDQDPGLALHQNAVFALEVFGSLTALLLRQRAGGVGSSSSSSSSSGGSSGGK